MLFFETVRLKNHANILSIIAILLPSAYRRRCRCWRLGFGASSSKLALSESCCCCCFVVVGSGVPSCGCVRWLLHFVVRGVLSLLSAATSPQSKLTYHFVSKFQQVIGKNREVFEIVLALLFSQQVNGLSNRCTSALANGLDGRFISRY